MKKKILLCSDLDRTIIPNGSEVESPEAREYLRYIASREEIILLYASGRNQELIKEAVKDYHLPVPDFAVGDVGTTMYSIENNIWKNMDNWSELIEKDWGGLNRDHIVNNLSNVDNLVLQEEEHQNDFKVSYYSDVSKINNDFIDYIKSKIFRELLITPCVIYSIDETKNKALIDILPLRATKYHAIKFLMNRLSVTHKNTVYSGDSGNDLPAVASDLQAVLVKNAREEIKSEAIKQAKKNGTLDTLYIAKGEFLDMNGNYSAGVIEGLAHYIPKVKRWLKKYRKKNM